MTSFPLTPRLYKTFQTIGQEITWGMRTFWNVIRAINRREGLLGDECQSYCHTDTCLNYKLKLVSNDDWWKKFSTIPFVYNLMIGYLKRIEKILRKRLLNIGIQKLGLKLNPGLTLIGLWTTGHRARDSNPMWWKIGSNY